MDITFCELRNKEVINTINGRRLGRVCDLVISCESCRILGIVVPNDRRLFRSKDDLFVPWKHIMKIGDDVILVHVFESRMYCEPNYQPHLPPPKKPLKNNYGAPNYGAPPYESDDN